MKSVFFLLLFIIFSCGKNETYNESDYDKKQGFVTETKIRNKSRTNTGYQVIYKIFIDSSKTLSRKDIESDFMTNENQPVVVFINKKDTSDYFIAYKGIIDNDLLFNYLEKENIPYYYRDTRKVILK